MATLDKHPETGEPGSWTYYGGVGWINNDAWQGPRTHYEDGTPVPDFSYRSKWNPNWSIRLNDIYGFVGQRAGAGRTRLRDDYNYATFNDPFWRTAEGRQWINQMAISNKSLEEINREMASMGERAEKKKAAWQKLRESGSNDGSADTSRGMFGGGYSAGRAAQDERRASQTAKYQREADQWDIDREVPLDYINKIAAQVDANWAKEGKRDVIGKEGDNRYMAGDADLPEGIKPPPDDGSEYQWVSSIGWTKVGGFTDRDRQLSIETAVRNSYGFDDKEVDAMRVANTGRLGWFMGGDQGNYMDINPHDEEDILRMFGEEGYNPYYGRGWNNSEWRDRATELKGGDDSFLNPWKNRVSGNMMDYLYQGTKGDVNTRWRTKHAFDKWMTENNVRQKDLFQTRMTERMFNDMGLGDIWGTGYDASYNEAYGGSGNPLENLRKAGGSSAGGSVFDAYAKERASQGNPTQQQQSSSVASLFDSYMKERNL